MTRTPLPSGRLRKWRSIIAITVAAVLVIATVTVLIDYRAPSTSSSPPLGPGIQVSVDPASLGTSVLSVSPSEFANVSIQIYSVVPTLTGYAVANLVGTNVTSNPYLDELFQGSPSSNGLVTGNLSAQFYPLDAGWVATMSPMTQSVSLQLYATLTVTQNGLTDQYTYFNNLAYNPRAPPAEFSATVSFPTHPTFSGTPDATTAVSTVITPARGPPPTCDPGYFWDPRNTTAITEGDVPLAIVNATASPSGAEVSYQISYIDTALQLSFTSATEWSNYTAYSGLQMSVEPSWSGDDTSFQGGVYGDGSNAGETPSMIGLGGAELTVTNYQEGYVWLSGSTCESEWLDAYSTNVQLDGFQGATFDVIETNLPAYFGSLLADMADWTPLNSSTLYYGTGGISLYSILETAEGYNNAEDAEAEAEDAFTAFDFALGAALLVCDVLNVIPGFSDVDSAPEAAVILGDVAGVAGDLMSLFSTVSFSTSEHTSVEQFSVSVNTQGAHDNLLATVYSASVAEQLSIGSNEYDPEMPLLYVDVT